MFQPYSGKPHHVPSRIPSLSLVFFCLQETREPKGWWNPPGHRSQSTFFQPSNPSKVGTCWFLRVGKPCGYASRIVKSRHLSYVPMFLCWSQGAVNYLCVFQQNQDEHSDLEWRKQQEIVQAKQDSWGFVSPLTAQRNLHFPHSWRRSTDPNLTTSNHGRCVLVKNHRLMKEHDTPSTVWSTVWTCYWFENCKLWICFI